MVRLSKQQITLVILVAAVAGVVGFKILVGPKVVAIDPIAARAKGNAQAKVKIVEFIDFECPACASGSIKLKDISTQYSQDIFMQVRYFPLTNMHRHAMQAALYSECAARQGKFWELHEQMMPQQKQWSQLLSADPIFQEMAKQAGMDLQKLNSCMSSDEVRKAINDERSLGQSMGVQSTPTYFINDKMVVGTKSLMEELVIYFPSLVPPSTPSEAASGRPIIERLQSTAQSAAQSTALGEKK